MSILMHGFLPSSDHERVICNRTHTNPRVDVKFLRVNCVQKKAIEISERSVGHPEKF